MRLIQAEEALAAGEEEETPFLALAMEVLAEGAARIPVPREAKEAGKEAKIPEEGMEAEEPDSAALFSSVLFLAVP